MVGTRLSQEPVVTYDTLKSPLLSPGFLQFPKVKFKLYVTLFCSWWRGWVFFQSKRSIHLKCNTICIDYTIINTDIYWDQTLQTVFHRITKQLKIGLEMTSTPFFNPLFGFWISNENTASCHRTSWVSEALDCRARGRKLEFRGWINT